MCDTLEATLLLPVNCCVHSAAPNWVIGGKVTTARGKLFNAKLSVFELNVGR